MLRMDPATLARIETGERGLSLEEALILSVAVGVAPGHMMIPRDNEELLPDVDDEDGGVTVDAGDARRWFAGRMPLSDNDDPRFYFAEAPRLVFELETTPAYRKVRLLDATLELAQTQALGGRVDDGLLDEFLELAQELPAELRRYVRDQRWRKGADGTRAPPPKTTTEESEREGSRCSEGREGREVPLLPGRRAPTFDGYRQGVPGN